MIIFSSELFYMYSETKGEELASSFHFNWGAIYFTDFDICY